MNKDSEKSYKFSTGIYYNNFLIHIQHLHT